MILKKSAFTWLPLLLTSALLACTPADEEYCESFGVGGTAEYGKCIAFYHQQEQLFQSDRYRCDLIADETYPRSLYDQGSWQPVRVGGVWRGRYRSRIEHVRIEPDWQHNAQIDSLRLRILGPCMEQQGWNSPDTWQAGRHPIALSKPATRSSSLPWLRR